MNTQVESSTQTPLDVGAEEVQEQLQAVADPIDQARVLVRMLSNNVHIKRELTRDRAMDFADDRTLLLAAVGIAIAHHLARVADALEQRNQPLPF